MICRRCFAKNPDSAASCFSCGASLPRRPAATKRLIWFLPATLAAVGLCIYVVHTLFRPPHGTEKTSGSETVAVVDKTVASPGRLTGKSTPLAAGTIVVRGSLDAKLYETEAAVVSGQWVALPAWLHIGGERVEFLAFDGSPVRLESGFWIPGDPLILWRIEIENIFDPPALSAWTKGIPVQWRPLAATEPSYMLDIMSPQSRDSYISIPLPEEIQKPGNFFQADRVIGWTFGQGMNKGFLWAGPAGKELLPNCRFDQLQARFFSHCREAQFIRVLAMPKDIVALEKFEAIAQGFRLPPLMAADDVPSWLGAQTFISQMDLLASELLRNDSSKEVVRVLDDSVLIGAADPILIKDAVLATARYKDYNRALQFLARIEKSLFQKTGQRLSGLAEFQGQLYKDWLREIIQKGGSYSGAATFEEARRTFPDDAEIHLLGVEAAMAENAWERAKELLRERDYPSLLKFRAAQLEARLQEQENAVATTIRFAPGERSIRVEALLNDWYIQKFILDTGAEKTAIPSSALKALGMAIDDRTPVSLITTASGLGMAYEVDLKSIELKGFRVENMEIFVLDLLGHSDTGILGLDFLNHFRFEIDNQQGLLRIRKKR